MALPIWDTENRYQVFHEVRNSTDQQQRMRIIFRLKDAKHTPRVLLYFTNPAGLTVQYAQVSLYCPELGDSCPQAPFPPGASPIGCTYSDDHQLRSIYVPNGITRYGQHQNLSINITGTTRNEMFLLVPANSRVLIVIDSPEEAWIKTSEVDIQTIYNNIPIEDTSIIMPPPPWITLSSTPTLVKKIKNSTTVPITLTVDWLEPRRIYVSNELESILTSPRYTFSTSTGETETTLTLEPNEEIFFAFTGSNLENLNPSFTYEAEDGEDIQSFSFGVSWIEPNVPLSPVHLYMFQSYSRMPYDKYSLATYSPFEFHRENPIAHTVDYVRKQAVTRLVASHEFDNLRGSIGRMFGISSKRRNHGMRSLLDKTIDYSVKAHVLETEWVYLTPRGLVRNLFDNSNNVTLGFLFQVTEGR